MRPLTDIDGISLDTAHSNSTGTQELITEQKLREVDQKIREYTTILGVAVDRRLEDVLVVGEERFDEIPTTLYVSTQLVLLVYFICLILISLVS